jgi:polyhydroxyalkanoate synthesis regulator phasin
MAETFTANWVGIVALVVALAVAGILIYLFKKGKMQTGDISAIAGVIDKVGDVLENFGKGDSVVGLLAEYAAKAVRVVEQLVKNGELEKDNELRKNEAKAIVEQLAAADGVDLELVYDNDETIDNLIEAAVNEMQSSAVKIELGVEDTGLPSELE